MGKKKKDTVTENTEAKKPEWTRIWSQGGGGVIMYRVLARSIDYERGGYLMYNGVLFGNQWTNVSASLFEPAEHPTQPTTFLLKHCNSNQLPFHLVAGNEDILSFDAAMSLAYWAKNNIRAKDKKHSWQEGRVEVALQRIKIKYDISIEREDTVHQPNEQLRLLGFKEEYLEHKKKDKN